MRTYTCKNMRKFCAFLLFFLMAGSLFAFNDDQPDSDEPQYRVVKVRLSERSIVAWGSLYINGRYRGKIRRGSSRRFRLRVSANHIFRMSRRYRGKLYTRERMVYLRAGEQPQWVILHPRMRERMRARGRIKIRLSHNSPVAYAYLFINSRPFGRIRRGQTRQFRVWSGRRHFIKVRRNWRGRLYLRRRSVFIEAGETRRITLQPRLRRW